MNPDVLEGIYQEALEERLVSHLAEKLGIGLGDAMDLYYRSRLAEKIHEGAEDIQYLDYRVLVEMLCQTEGDLIAEYQNDR